MKRQLTFVLLGVVAAVFVRAGGSAFPAAIADESIVQVSEDPFTNPTSQHRTEVEPDTFAFGATWVSAFQVGLSFAAGSSGIGFATSSDHGHSFVQGVLPGVTTFNEPPGSYDFAADASVAFDRLHQVWLISYLAIHASPTGTISIADVLVSRSRDAVHWDLPVLVATQNVFLDKNWTVCDNSPRSPFFGTCYTEFNVDRTSRADSPVMVSASRDGGLSWGAPQTAGNGNAGQPLVQPSGRVVMPFRGLCGGLVQVQVCAVSSDDGGMSWSEPVVISSNIFHPTMPALRTPPLPSAAIDREGRIYVVWKDCRFEPFCDPAHRASSTNDLVFSTSDDGVSWSEMRRIPLEPVNSNIDHFLPGIGADPVSAGDEARLALAYYFLKQPADCTNPADCPCSNPAKCEL